jgi:hypothetical protein
VGISCGALCDDDRFLIETATISEDSTLSIVEERHWLRWLFSRPRNTETQDQRNKHTVREATHRGLKRLFRIFQDISEREYKDKQRDDRILDEMDRLSRFKQSDFRLSASELQTLPKHSTLFRTHHSIGSTICHQIPGDHMVFIDGAGPPFILRPVGSGINRIVGYCYVWKARN